MLDCADVNLGNRIDVAVASASPSSTVIATNRAAGLPGFFALPASGLPGLPRGALSFADIDNDGYLDIMSPLADVATGKRFLVQRGNAGEAELWKLRGLAPGLPLQLGLETKGATSLFLRARQAP